MKFLSYNVPTNFEGKGFSPPHQAMPEEYKHEDPVTAYRALYRGDKRRFAKWPVGKTPRWFN